MILISAEGEDFLATRRKPQVSRDDRECAFFSHHAQKTRGNDVDSVKRERVQMLCLPNQFSRVVLARLSATELRCVVEEQVSRSLAVLHCQSRERLMFGMKFHHASEINVADHIYVVQDERFVSAARIQKKMRGLLQPATGVEQRVLVRNFNPHSEVLVRFQILHDHVSKMMGINNDVVNSEFAQTGERKFQRRAPGNVHQGLGTIIGKRAQARAQAGSQNHGLHSANFSSSRWRTTTSTPFLARKCLASCSAK